LATTTRSGTLPPRTVCRTKVTEVRARVRVRVRVS
jgi:hypothetical protein